MFYLGILIVCPICTFLYPKSSLEGVMQQLPDVIRLSATSRSPTKKKKKEALQYRKKSFLGGRIFYHALGPLLPATPYTMY